MHKQQNIYPSRSLWYKILQMREKRAGKLKTKIILSVLTCFIAVSFPSIFILFSYMNNLVFEEAGNVVRAQISSEIDNVNNELYSLIDAVAWICSQDDVKNAMSYSSIYDDGAMRAVIRVQRDIDTYMAASPAWEHLHKIVLFNPQNNFAFECVNWRSGSLIDSNLITSSDSFPTLSFPSGTMVQLMLSETINDPKAPAVAAYGKVQGTDAYVYAEVSMDIFSGIMQSQISNVYISSDSYSYPEEIPEELYHRMAWERNEYQLAIPGVSVVHFINKAPLDITSAYGLAVFISVLIASLLLFLLLSLMLSRFLTRTSSRLVRHIEYLMDTNDFGYTDSTIEEGDDEMASIGRTLNAMSVSISNLLKRNEALYEDKRKMEIDMLQMQVNPHFLYNTLESMHYLADIQKNDGIAKMSRGLSTLLRNMAKGPNDKITLREELSLLHDYDDIQQVRYIGMYEIIYDVPEELEDFLIQKFTLQPLVENAIFHGIEPSGHWGTITIKAEKKDDSLEISVHDDGIGIADDEITHIFDERKHSKTDMTGVGIRNIDERIKLVYGSEYGLSFRSEKGKYTTVIARIKAERDGKI